MKINYRNLKKIITRLLKESSENDAIINSLKLRIKNAENKEDSKIKLTDDEFLGPEDLDNLNTEDWF